MFCHFHFMVFGLWYHCAVQNGGVEMFMQFDQNIEQ